MDGQTEAEEEASHRIPRLRLESIMQLFKHFPVTVTAKAKAKAKATAATGLKQIEFVAFS